MPETTGQMAEDNKNDDALLDQYLRVCNKVLEKNRGRFPYSQIWQAGEQALSGRVVELAVFDENPIAHCRVTLHANRISSKRMPEDEPAPMKRLSAQYVQDVVSHPEKYIENPSLIDWDWLQLMK
ncbi:MAG: hypothetical protein HWE25_08525 [Alphaproteobacteria bacterium]|nr:hypothetical protein [Alphaproteobacteria bacterium]